MFAKFSVIFIPLAIASNSFQVIAEKPLHQINRPSLTNVLYLKSVSCDGTFTGQSSCDPISIRISDRVVWGSHPMTAGNAANLSGVPSQTFHSQIYISIFANDSTPIYNGLIWSVGEGTISFNSDRASYTLRYQVAPSQL